MVCALRLSALAAGMLDVSAGAGDVFRDCDVCPQMAVVPAGSFMMGSPKAEAGRYAVEEPLRRVEIGQPFAVGAYEVTREEYEAFAAETGQADGAGCWLAAGGKWEREKSASRRNPGYEQTGREPAVCVSWRDAQAYARWLSRKTGKPYRLLSEAEWEYAARAGTQTPYGFGSVVSARRANYDGNVGKTAPAGAYKPNGFGLYDMHGNAWEWVRDCWNAGYAGAPTDGSARQGGDCSRRVMRGGSWSDRSRSLRSAHRGRHFGGLRFNNVGFRVARTLAPAGER